MQKDVRLIEHNTAVVANAINIVALALGEVLGKQVPRQLNNAPVTDDALVGLVAARMKNKLAL